MLFSSILLLLGLGLGTWLWFDTLSSLEAARLHCKRACKHYNLQLLDDSVSLSNTSLARDERGRLVLQRSYKFEFQHLDEDDRISASLLLRGNKLIMMDIPHYMQRTFF
jgi:hypothetical protein